MQPWVPGSLGCARSSIPAQTTGAETDGVAPLPDAVRARVHDHPCYSEGAHHHYARMHLAVAPACNIQCHYCNRKFDCSNESRPGVVSELLTPEQAAHKAMAVAARIPQLTVIGIAGPGDPLANPERTFDTLRLVRARAPDMKLCVSTNGLALPGLVDDLVRCGVDHVTITINCVDPEIGAMIYPWIFWQNRRVKGRRAAEILIEQQQKGLEALVAHGVLVKVNSVLIPGVNDCHLSQVSRVVKAKGAFLHNLLPLIAEPSHGTFYGLMGQRPPTAEELSAAQDACGADMRLMRHCRQCRADAIGLLGDDRGSGLRLADLAEGEVDDRAAMEARQAARAAIERSRAAARPAAEVLVPLAAVGRRSERADAVLMAVASRDGTCVDQHFGQASELLVYEVSARRAVRVGTLQVEPYCSGADACGGGDAALRATVAVLAGCAVLLCAQIGYEPWRRLEAAGIQPNGEHADEPIDATLRAVYRELAEAGRLKPVRSTPDRLTA